MSYLRLYSSISLEKFITLLDKKMDVATLRAHLLCLVHKTYQLTIKGSGVMSDATRESTALQRFYLERDILQVTDSSTQKKYGEVFLSNSISLIMAISDIKKQKKIV